ncbi:MAG: phosphoserine phosphatase SerB [Alphaproteobacteria bacterium]|nr:phosphoserine phosphatase SerB [Alphaproteobacteria bacterium]
MDSVLVLIAAPGSGAIGPELVEALRDLGGGAPHWLAEGEACEVEAFARIPEFLIELRKVPVDAAVVSIHNRRKRLLLADMDSTMIQQECIDELGVVAGVGDHIKAVTAKAMRGELDFEGALRERVALLKDLPASVVEDVLQKRITYMPGGRVLVQTMRANGAYAALVSGGFTAFTGPVAWHLGFDENRANLLEVANGALTGRVVPPILGQAAKRSALFEISARLGLSPQDALCVGDGANDLAMLSEAGMGVALHAKPNVQESSLIRINHADLTALLYLQGYRKAQIATG